MSFQNRKSICSLLLTIRNFQHNSSHRPVTLELNKQSGGVCPIMLISKYFISRPKNAGPLFVFPDGKPIPRSFFIAYLKKALSVAGIPTNKFHGHSFRIGGASFAAANGYTVAQIQSMGRWKSGAFRKYIRISTISTS